MSDVAKHECIQRIGIGVAPYRRRGVRAVIVSDHDATLVVPSQVAYNLAQACLLHERRVVVVQHNAVLPVIVTAAGVNDDTVDRLNPEPVERVAGELAITQDMLRDGRVTRLNGQTVSERRAASIGEDAAMEIRTGAGARKQDAPIVGGDRRLVGVKNYSIGVKAGGLDRDPGAAAGLVEATNDALARHADDRSIRGGDSELSVDDVGLRPKPDRAAIGQSGNEGCGIVGCAVADSAKGFDGGSVRQLIAEMACNARPVGVTERRDRSSPV